MVVPANSDVGASVSSQNRPYPCKIAMNDCFVSQVFFRVQKLPNVRKTAMRLRAPCFSMLPSRDLDTVSAARSVRFCEQKAECIVVWSKSRSSTSCKLMVHA